MKNKSYLTSVVYIIIGIALFILSLMSKLDEFWSGMGSALFVMGVIQLLRFRRINNNPEYREKVELELHDERNHFLRNKAWAYAGYLYVIGSAIMTIVFKVMGYDTLSMFASSTTCIMLVLFWLSFYYLRSKY